MFNQEKLMEQIRKVQADVQEVQEEISEMDFIGYAAGESVQILISGNNERIHVKLSPSVVDPQTIEFLQELIEIALRDVLAKIQDATAERMAEVTGGLELPGFD